MTTLTKEQEQYIEHEVKIRLHDERFKVIEKDLEELKNSIHHLDSKLASSIKYLDNKFMLMFSLILGSIWIPFILIYLHITK